ncbi:MAG: Zn-dependent oligopeptidase [Elusimicrobia bacterium]|nr:Zn-dependent oligopeptidase [Elusimicrobiota bacterium]
MRITTSRLAIILLLILAVFPLPSRAVDVIAPQGIPSRPVMGPGINWKLDPAQIAGQYAAAQSQLEASLKGILGVPAGARNFDNTVKAFETANAVFDQQIQSLAFLGYVSPDKAVREAGLKVEADAGAYGVAVWARPGLYQAVKDYADKGETLTGEDGRLLTRMLREFKSSGHGLSPEDKDKLQKIQERLSVISTEFEGNINADNGGMDVKLEDLKGLPDDIIKRLQQNQTPDGKIRVTLKYPDYIPFMKYADNGELRRQLQLKYQNRAVEKNLPILSEALRLRDQSAKLLGYSSFPEKALEGRMAETPQKVWDFLNGLWPILRTQDQDLKDLLAEKRKDDPKAERVESWELSYYSDKLRKARFDLDSEEVKKYFPVDTVVAGTMRVYQRILGVTFTEVASPEAWHSDVRLFRINDGKDGREIGYFYLDIHPRQGKYSHAAAFTIIQGRELEQNGYLKPVSAMVANFPKGAPGQPALLPHSDVETFFHEFGHLMHQTLTKARYATFSGSSVARDFVEAPSQMLENFVWEREVLDEISGHYQDPSKKLPDALFQKMLAAKNFGNGIHYLTQLAFAMIDMLYHTAVPADTSRLFNQMMELVGLVPVNPGAHSEASFGHLMGGYAAGYYGYLWSEVFADDIFTRFKKEGLFSPAVGKAWREEVLEKGSSRPEMESLIAFLGRLPSSEAFFKRLRGAKPGA